MARERRKVLAQKPGVRVVGVEIQCTDSPRESKDLNEFKGAIQDANGFLIAVRKAENNELRRQLDLALNKDNLEKGRIYY